MAQVYFRHVHSSVPQAKLALCGFTRVYLKARRIGTKSPLTFLPSACATGTREKKQYVVDPENTSSRRRGLGRHPAEAALDDPGRQSKPGTPPAATPTPADSGSNCGGGGGRPPRSRA